jgi:hypothetical protein
MMMRSIIKKEGAGIAPEREDEDGSGATLVAFGPVARIQVHLCRVACCCPAGQERDLAQRLRPEVVKCGTRLSERVGYSRIRAKFFLTRISSARLNLFNLD